MSHQAVELAESTSSTNTPTPTTIDGNQQKDLATDSTVSKSNSPNEKDKNQKQTEFRQQFAKQLLVPNGQTDKV